MAVKLMKSQFVKLVTGFIFDFFEKEKVEFNFEAALYFDKPYSLSFSLRIFDDWGIVIKGLSSIVRVPSFLEFTENNAEYIYSKLIREYLDIVSEN